jgi:hypothetical protein
MWRALCAVVLLPTLTAAQSEATGAMAQEAASRAGRSVETSPVKPAYSSFTYYNEIRQGTTEEVAVQRSAPGFVTLSRSAVPGIAPLRLELQPAEGFMIGKIRYPKTFKRKLAFQPEPVRVTTATWNPILFNLRVDRNASLGMHVLTGKMTFQSIDAAKGAGAVQEVEVQIPVMVVRHDAKVSRGRWPVYKTPVALIVVLIVLSPILIPLVIPIYLVCIAAGPRNCPD